MSTLSKNYQPEQAEQKWYRFWEQRGDFRAPPNGQPTYSICLPPPNVTGVLHMGHALTNTLQDILIRFKRMCGYRALWIPGTDHAGIATQTAVERHLRHHEGKKRDDYTKEELLEHLWQWKRQREANIVAQLKRLGCSCDWSRLAFTLDPLHSRAVYKVFKQLFDAGLIYQGDYLVNWDPSMQTAIADEEVEYEEQETQLWYLDYPLLGTAGSIQVATTRPETMLADVAIAVAPNDQRYRHLVGRYVRLPLTDRVLPILSDRLVDPTFGSGVVKITPGHDRKDYEMGQRHQLPLINLMTRDGRINAHGGPFAGLLLLEARKQIVAVLQEEGLVAKVEPYRHRVGVSYRSRAIIEPYLSKQWFVRLSAFQGQLRAVVEDKHLRLIPSHWEKTYLHWMDNLHDWCISRQLVWGHRIPIWKLRDDPEVMVCHDRCGVPEVVAADPDKWQQEEGVLDTWFSSALWPLSMLGWPEKNEQLDRFYPHAAVITGHDILFFWVARMVLMGEYLLGQLPFGEVFLHGLIYGKSYWKRDAEGQIFYLQGAERARCQNSSPLPLGVETKWEKMSKSKGNVIDSDAMIARYGADAVRMALAASATHAQQIDLDERLFAEYKNFSNKVWNGARFVLGHLHDLSAHQLLAGVQKSLCAVEDRWLLSLLNRTIQRVNHSLEHYAFDQAATAAYQFYWKEFCAYYIEAAKPVLNGQRGSSLQRTHKQLLLLSTLVTCIRLLHPITPFVTEEIFQELKKSIKLPAQNCACPYLGPTIKALRQEACIIAPYPRHVATADICKQSEEEFLLIAQVVYAIRNMRAEMQVPPRVATPLLVVASVDSAALVTVRVGEALIRSLVPISHFVFATTTPAVCSATAVVADMQLLVPLGEQGVVRETNRLRKERERLLVRRDRLVGLLANRDFCDRAVPEVVDKRRAELMHLAQSLDTIEQQLVKLGMCS